MRDDKAWEFPRPSLIKRHVTIFLISIGVYQCMFEKNIFDLIYSAPTVIVFEVDLLLLSRAALTINWLISTTNAYPFIGTFLQAGLTQSSGQPALRKALPGILPIYHHLIKTIPSIAFIQLIIIDTAF
nr:hypothetical protein [Halomonas elongata]